ncbi:MAG: hypothetical protein OEL77_07445 [Nitrosopumilus sp.]|nr:hypothetical protein [Nitrosopumilus sp.]MDH3385828.1 hypothetical protein [Nitrosopumilus sp.]
MRPSLFKIGIGLTVLGMIWLSVVFYQGDKISEKFSIKSSDSEEIEMYLEGNDIGYYKIFMPEFAGIGVFVQILDENRNVISDGIVETKMSVGYFDFEGGMHVAKISNLSNDQMNLEVEFGDTNGKEMVLPGIVTLAGGLMIVISSFIKLRDYRIEQPDENIS